jgi:poly-gamma-glutamate capsule biosynthesis protein CapA/YwtB (metallophosphatase superfamily)
MRLAPTKLARRALALLAAGALALPVAGRAAPLAQGGGLDQPLLAANMCGAGDPGHIHFTLAATGDTFPHENIQNVGEAQGYDYLFDHVRPFLKAADLAYTNFDGAMLAGSPYTGYPAFNYNPKLAAALKDAGIGLVSTANNHIMDRGPEGLDATLQVLQQAGIVQHGTVASPAADQPRPVYLPLTLTRGGTNLKIAFLSFSWGTNGIPDPLNQVNLLWQSNEYGAQGGIRQDVLEAITQARREADFVIVAAHWGYEYQLYPDASQIEGARQMAAAGADVILGAQAHTLQPVDLLTNNGRRTLVIYSLANFLVQPCGYSLLVLVTIDDRR